MTTFLFPRADTIHSLLVFTSHDAMVTLFCDLIYTYKTLVYTLIMEN